MKISYKKLRHLMVDRNIKQMELARISGISSTAVAKLKKDESVSLSVLLRVCEALKCDIGEIAEAIPDNRHTDPELEEKE